MTSLRRTFYSTLIACGLTHALAAQSAPLRRGAWIGIAPSFGSPKVSCNFCQSGRETGFAGTLDAGVVVAQRFGVGVEGGGWFHDVDNVGHRLWSLSLAGHFYPDPRSGLSLKVTAGYATYTAGDSTGTLKAKAPAFGAGIGWETRVVPHLLIQPYVDFFSTIPTTLRFEDQDVTGGTTVTQLRVGMGIRYYGGR